MSGYLDFKRTGHPVIDNILDAIEIAGDGFHNTSQWDDDLGDGKSYVDLIDEEIEKAKKALDELNAQLDELNADLSEFVENQPKI